MLTKKQLRYQSKQADQEVFDSDYSPKGRRARKKDDENRTMSLKDEANYD